MKSPMIHRFFSSGLILVVTILSIQLKAAEPKTSAKANRTNSQWGTLTGQFLYSGKAIVREKVSLNKDQEFCGKNHPLTEDVIVDPKTKGIQNVIIWLEHKEGPDSLPIHPSLKKKATVSKELDNKNCRFAPRVTVLNTGQTLKIGNQDAIAHQATLYCFRNEPISVSLVREQKKPVSYSFPKEEPLPVKITCPIHPWMKAWLVIKSHPYVAVTDAKGTFELKHLPVGNWTFRAWHESVGYLTNVSITVENNTTQTTWKSGRFPVEIANRKQHLGTITISEREFDLE